MMYSKVVLFNDIDIAREILKTSDVAAIKALGRQVSDYVESDWNGIRQLVIYEGFYAKFSQNEELKKQLLDTKDALLAECAVKDTIWVIGLSMKD